MIPTKTESHVITNNMGEGKAFTIATNGKAFRVLIDGLYSDKILAPVRELMTNAWDAQAAAGNADRPFKVIVPVEHDPVFGVRDYGEGMDHETVMNLYTTLFSSSKEETNDQVGMLGLGSKSPFAYTDSFTVTCYDGREKRVYTAYLQNDVPTLSAVFQGPSDEERGVHVTFPVLVSDIPRFRQAIQRVVVGFDLLPEWDGDTFEAPALIKSGKGWRLFNTPYGTYGRVMPRYTIRQGCVVYPAPDHGFKFHEHDIIPYADGVMVDVPIGTFDVATSREALVVKSDADRRIVATAFDKAFDELMKETKEAWEACTTDLEKARFHSTTSWHLLRAIGAPTYAPALSLMPKGWSPKEIEKAIEMNKPGYFVRNARKTSGSGLLHSTSYEKVSSYFFLLDNDPSVKVMRKMSRIKDFCAYRNDKVFLIPFKSQALHVARIKALWGADDSAFIPVESLMDPGPPQRRAKGVADSITNIRQALDDGAYWLTRMRGNIVMSEELKAIQYHLNRSIVDAFTAIVGDPDADIIYLTEGQVEKVRPSDDTSVDKIVVDHYAQFIGDAEDRYTTQGVRNAIHQRCKPYTVADAIIKAAGVPTKNVFTVEERVAFQLVKLQRREELDTNAEELFEEIRNKFPNLFPLNEAEALQYIEDQIKAQENKS